MSRKRQGRRWLRLAGLIIGVVWAGFWVYFGVASGTSERLTWTSTLLHTALPGLIFLVSAALAYLWELLGGILLIAEGLMAIIAYPLAVTERLSLPTIILALVTMSLPALLAGSLFILSWHRKEPPVEVETKS